MANVKNRGARRCNPQVPQYTGIKNHGIGIETRPVYGVQTQNPTMTHEQWLAFVNKVGPSKAWARA